MNPLPPLGPPNDKFTPELRILVASLLSMAVILLWAKYIGPKPPTRSPQENQPMVSAPPTSGPEPATAPANEATPPSNAAVNAASSAKPTAETQERTIVVENALYRVEFSSRGAVVKSWQLKNYKDDSRPRRTLDLVHSQAAEQTGWPFSIVLDDPQSERAANTALYRVSGQSDALEAPAELTFTWSDGRIEITKHFRFDHSYVVDVETTAALNGSPIHVGLAWRGGFGDLTVTNPIPVETVFTYYSEIGGKLVTFPHKKLEGPERWGSTWAGGKLYAGIQDRYFTAAFLPPLDSLSTPLLTRYWKVMRSIVAEGKSRPNPCRKSRRPPKAIRCACACSSGRRTTTS